MNIQPIFTTVEPSPTSGVRPSEAVSTGAVTETESRVGAAATYWISPPGQFFSVLHEVSQQYPVELHEAALALVRGASMPPDAESVAAAATELVRDRVETRPRSAVATYRVLDSHASVDHVQTPTSAAPPASPLDAMVKRMKELASTNPSEMRSMAVELAVSFATVAAISSGPGGDAMSTLAMQLEQSANMGPPALAPTPHWQRGASPSVSPAHSIGAANHAVDDERPADEAPSWMRTPSARPAAR